MRQDTEAGLVEEAAAAAAAAVARPPGGGGGLGGAEEPWAGHGSTPYTVAATALLRGL